MRQYFSDLKISEIVTISVIFNTVSPRKTRSEKDYLVIELFDGRDKLVGNYWDWSGKAMPNAKDTVYKVSGQVTEYQGQKQITIKSITTDGEMQVADFMPSSGSDMNEIYKNAWSFISNNLTDDLLLNLCLGALEKYKDLWLTVPAAVGVHHAFVGGTLIHSLRVAQLASSMARCIPEANHDICLAGAFLHDLGKLAAYSIEGATIHMTDSGKLFEHAHMGCNMLANLAFLVTTPLCQTDALKIDILEHIILSHHGLLEHGAVVEPQSIEAHLVHAADKADATAQMIKEASDKTEEFWTDKIWGLNNRTMINYKHMLNLKPMSIDDFSIEEK